MYHRKTDWILGAFGETCVDVCSGFGGCTFNGESQMSTVDDVTKSDFVLTSVGENPSVLYFISKYY